MTYDLLYNPTKFQKSVTVTIGFKSGDLKRVISAHKKWHDSQFPENLRALWRNLQLWKKLNPLESRNLGPGARGKLVAQLENDIIKMAESDPSMSALIKNYASMTRAQLQAEADGALSVVEHKDVINRHRQLKLVGGVTKATVGATKTAIANSAQTSAVVDAVKTGANVLSAVETASASNPVTLPISAALQVTKSVLAVRSAVSTKNHINGLQGIQEWQKIYFCNKLIGSDNVCGHDAITQSILPYVIQQKKKKLAVKSVEAVPVVGGITTSVVKSGKKVKKILANELGKQRAEMARNLAEHFVTHDCTIADAIVAELYSEKEKDLLKLAPYAEVYDNLLKKLHST